MEQIYHHELEFKVRDYECDLQGIVNNSVYMNYLEHARHELCRSVGLRFEQLVDMGIYTVVARADLTYKTSLKSCDMFVVKTRVELSGLKYIFYQDIYRLPDNKLCLKGITITVSIINGKLALSDILVEAIAKIRGQKSEVRNQRSEIRGEKSEVRN